MPIYHRRLPDPTPLPVMPGHLLLYGPQVPVQLTLPDGEQPGGPSLGVVPGNALIDTGAGTTRVNLRRLRELGFADAAHNSRHRVRLEFTGERPLPARVVDVFGDDMSMREAPDLLMLLGRDVLQDFVLVYDGKHGHFILAS